MSIYVAYCRVQPRLTDGKDIEVAIGNYLFKKIQIFVRPHRANVKVGDGHDRFSILSCVTRGRFDVSSCCFLAVNQDDTLIVRHRHGQLATLRPFSKMEAFRSRTISKGDTE